MVGIIIINKNKVPKKNLKNTRDKTGILSPIIFIKAPIIPVRIPEMIIASLRILVITLILKLELYKYN